MIGCYWVISILNKCQNVALSKTQSKKKLILSVPLNLILKVDAYTQTQRFSTGLNGQIVFSSVGKRILKKEEINNSLWHFCFLSTSDLLLLEATDLWHTAALDSPVC